ncbi:MAG: hypothetical protein Q9M97_03135 [Candidatus Gracilibacteria bacterium]|nr:hypothetical protein [Candidatus Gracilibacteria bacterium]
MTYSDADTANSTGGGTDWNTFAYDLSKTPVSMAGKYPIADITQPEAITSCQKMGGYLITNNQWMTIARNIEEQKSNYISGGPGTGILKTGVSDSDNGCGNTSYTKSIYTGLSRNWATKTGGGFGNTACDNKRQLKLSNGETIWDLSGNVWEHVNKSNTIDGTNYNNGETAVSGSSAGTNRDDDGIYAITDMDKYGSKYHLGKANGMGNLYYANGVANNIFIRGGRAAYGTHAGVFTLILSGTSTNYRRNMGFRCVTF